MTCLPTAHASHFYSTVSQGIALVLLIVAIYQWLGKKGLLWLRRLIQKSEDQIKALEQKKISLAENQRDLDESIQEQIALFEHLTKMVMLWQSVQEKKIALIATHREQLAHTLSVTIKKREATLRKMYLAQRVVPQACEQAHALLQKQFASQEQGNRFLSTLCHRIEQQV